MRGHRVHRVATAAFWRTFSDEGKISPGWWGWGGHAHPLTLHLPSPVKLQCTLQLSGQIHWPCFISTNIWTLWSSPILFAVLCTQCSSSSQVRVYRIQYTFKHMNITRTAIQCKFTNKSLIKIMKRMRSGSTMKIEHECIYLNLMLTHGTPKRW